MLLASFARPGPGRVLVPQGTEPGTSTALFAFRHERTAWQQFFQKALGFWLSPVLAKQAELRRLLPAHQSTCRSEGRTPWAGGSAVDVSLLLAAIRESSAQSGPWQGESADIFLQALTGWISQVFSRDPTGLGKPASGRFDFSPARSGTVVPWQLWFSLPHIHEDHTVTFFQQLCLLADIHTEIFQVT